MIKYLGNRMRCSRSDLKLTAMLVARKEEAVKSIFRSVTISVAIGLCILFEAKAEEFAPSSADDITLSVYGVNSATVVAQVHAAKVLTDYERRGFFRIGLLPIPVAEDVQIEIQSAECLTNVIAAVGALASPSAGIQHLELRKIEIKSMGTKEPGLSAAVARVNRDGSLELSTVSLFGVPGQSNSIPKADLQLGGRYAGWLHWNSEGQGRCAFLFGTTSNKKL
jgi:hypothetical protein